jgi:hypothetical protein
MWCVESFGSTTRGTTAKQLNTIRLDPNAVELSNLADIKLDVAVTAETLNDECFADSTLKYRPSLTRTIALDLGWHTGDSNNVADAECASELSRRHGNNGMSSNEN